MVIYSEGLNGGIMAIYFDNEGHTIHYTVSIPEPNTAVFDSDPAQPGPRFRLTLRVTGRSMASKFEAAAPGQTNYQAHISGVSTRK